MSRTAGTADGLCEHAVLLAKDHGRTDALSLAGWPASSLTVQSPPKTPNARTSPARHEALPTGVTPYSYSANDLRSDFYNLRRNRTKSEHTISCIYY